MTKRQKGEKTKDKKTERQKTKTKVRVQYCDVRAVSHSCDVFFIISGTLKLELRDKDINSADGRWSTKTLESWRKDNREGTQAVQCTPWVWNDTHRARTKMAELTLSYYIKCLQIRVDF